MPEINSVYLWILIPCPCLHDVCPKMREASIWCCLQIELQDIVGVFSDKFCTFLNKFCKSKAQFFYPSKQSSLEPTFYKHQPKWGQFSFSVIAVEDEAFPSQLQCARPESLDWKNVCCDPGRVITQLIENNKSFLGTSAAAREGSDPSSVSGLGPN